MGVSILGTDIWTMAVMSNAEFSRALTKRTVGCRPRRREVVIGIAAVLAPFASSVRAFAQKSDVPDFRSGRFQFTILRPQQLLPSIRLFQLGGKTINLSALRGRPVLLNFWATWCAACRTELPILDRLQERDRDTGLTILAVSEDRADRIVVERFIAGLNIRNLPIYLDPNGYVGYSDADNKRMAPFALYGMPITYAIAASGWVVGYMPGAADWTSAAAAGLIEFLGES